VATATVQPSNAPALLEADARFDVEVPVPSADPSRKLDAGMVGAFLCGSVAVLLASIPPLNFATKPLGALGLVIGLAAGVWPAWKNGRPLGVPIAICALCLITMVFLGKLPRLHQTARPASVAVLLKPAANSMAAHPTVRDDEWVDAATHAMQTQDLRVQVAAVQIGKVKLQEQKKEFLSSQKYLAIQLQIGYHGAALELLDYEPWADVAGAASKNPPVLMDASGRTYPQIALDAGTRLAGRGEHLFLTAGRQVRETLIFAVPPTLVEDLRLRLPASAFGIDGEFRFKIPRSMIKTM
jgi:hypothetical protein